ncbi:MAG: type II toxin-antitoxin system RelB/DinJ family antitoxin [Paludibacteraceae bacterium]|nr:type II toxin-antitoxin system RelB/DinJ family antitoxin [Paludibacteraceae bacterium]
MNTSTLQLRIDNDLKQQATTLFEGLGMDLSTAIRIFLKKSVSENGLPFEVRKEPYISQKGLDALYALNRESTNNGKEGMSEYMVAEKIAEYRTSKRKK